jgi:hypothetical protein
VPDVSDRLSFVSPFARRTAFVSAAIFAVTCPGVFFWLKSQHVPAAAIDVAKTFVSLLNDRQFPQAYELTTKEARIGTSASALEAIAAGQACKADRVVGTSPFQSNGNRLRRWLSGAAIEVPQIRIEFEGACLLAVTVAHTDDGRWLVSAIASHAG